MTERGEEKQKRSHVVGSGDTEVGVCRAKYGDVLVHLEYGTTFDLGTYLASYIDV